MTRSTRSDCNGSECRHPGQNFSMSRIAAARQPVSNSDIPALTSSPARNSSDPQTNRLGAGRSHGDDEDPRFLLGLDIAIRVSDGLERVLPVDFASCTAAAPMAPDAP